MTVPIVTTTHMSSMKRRRPSRSAIKVCVSAPTASPAIYTATTYINLDHTSQTKERASHTAPVKPFDGLSI